MRLNKIKDNDNDETSSTLIAENISALLQKNDLNANQLANILGVPAMTIRRVISGETEDPRISTLKIIADYFGVSLDMIVGNPEKEPNISSKQIKPNLIPKLSWDILQKLQNIDEAFSENWPKWQSFTLNNNDIAGEKIFALESRPSMYPRYPKGTIFIIDPETKPADGDVVLIKLKENNEFTLRELIIDPPYWRFSSLVPDSHTINFSEERHEIIGVSLLTMLYNSKLGM